jgi:hypothetical protein
MKPIDKTRLPKASEFKFGTYAAIDIKPCKARKKLEAVMDKYRACLPAKQDRIKVVIEGYFSGVQSGFDGIGQEFTIEVTKAKVVK